MKTLLFTLEYPPFNGGVANYYGNLAKYWPISEKLNILNNNRNELISGTGSFSWWPAIFTLERKISQDKYDYLMVGQILPLGTAAYLVSLVRPIKYLVFLHGMDLALALKTPRKRFLSKLILNRADKIICANSYVQERLIENFPDMEAKVTIVNPGIEGGVPNIDQNELREIASRYDLEGKTTLLSLGRLVKRKGVDQTIAALIKMPPKDSANILYFIAGIGPREAYLRNLVPIEWSKSIIFLGELSDSEKWAWLTTADIFIMPSRDIEGDFEGFGIVYLEANLCAKPVIAGNSGGVRDAVIHNFSGLLVDPEKLDSISDAIIRLTKDSDLRALLGAQGKIRALQDFNWENQAARVSKFIQKK